MTPHNNANPGDIAKTLIMPGDPLRAKYIAENFLENAKCYNTVRNMLGYTGTYKGNEISVQGSGMGIPSIAIYAEEAFTQYNVDSIIRVGTIGGMSEKVELRDMIIASGACTDSAFASQYHLNGTFSAIADFDLLEKAVNIARKRNKKFHVGNILSSDHFYNADKDASNKWLKMGVLGVEMESYALYTLAARYSKKALCISTCSDHLFKGTQTSPEERERTFNDMIETALETAIA